MLYFLYLQGQSQILNTLSAFALSFAVPLEFLSVLTSQKAFSQVKWQIFANKPVSDQILALSHRSRLSLLLLTRQNANQQD